MTQQPIRIFIAYARKDEPMLNELRVFLRPLERRKDITMWYDGEIMPGETWEKSIKDNLYTADLILLLMSAASIDSDYFWDKERADALARHRDGECHVVPIILKPCGWKHTELAKLQALPTDGKPITLWATHDEALHSVLEGLVELVNNLQELAAKRQAEKERQQRNPTIKMISIPGKDFQLSETPITIEQYLAFCKATGSHYPEWLEKGNEYNIHTGTTNAYKSVGMSESNSNYPIIGVSALDADAFCKWMGGRLPTEQEWEYAAKGGQNYEYAGSDDIDAVAWYDSNSGGKCHPVKQKQPNGYGLYDMSGNVWEWTSSKEGTSRVLRGGSWRNYAHNCRVANRGINTPLNRFNNYGFRLVSVYVP